MRGLPQEGQRGARSNGRDLWPEVYKKFYEDAKNEWDYDDVVANMRAAMQGLHMLCNPYLQYFYSTDAVLRHHMAKDKTRGEEVAEIERSLLDKYRNPELNEKPPELSQRGGAHYSTAAFHLLGAIEHDTGSQQIVCCRNNGAIPTFDDEASVEVPARIDRTGATALPQNAPAPGIRGLMQQVKAYETLTVEAAVTGNREAAYQAMLENPLMPEARECSALLDELLDINRHHLEGAFF